jgi:uncharacterized Ntn-hydrolase superfamily protein
MTYSIVAREPNSGMIGVAVQSHYFSVGSVVTWARAGVGAVATQSFAELSYGPVGLELMASGKSAVRALEALLLIDSKKETRQVAMVDASGNVGVHTGSDCIPYAGHIKGDGFSVQANLMDNDTIWGSMRDAYLENTGMDFPERLVTALKAAERAGGDIRGRQSAALLIVEGRVFPNPWMGRIVELRVEDHKEPVEELARLLRLKRAYEWADKADSRFAEGAFAEADVFYKKAFEFAPDVLELKYWRGVSLIQSGNEAEGRTILEEVYGREPRWKKLTSLLIKANRIKGNFD